MKVRTSNGKVYEVVEEREKEFIVIGKATIWGNTYSIAKWQAEIIEEQNYDYEPNDRASIMRECNRNPSHAD